MNKQIFFEDIALDEAYSAEPYPVSHEEVLAFNRKWDWLPIHVDDAAARANGFKAITASGQYTLCVKQHFINAMPWCASVVGAIGFDELRFLRPVYGGETISVAIRCFEKRGSNSKRDRGICKFNVVLSNQGGEPVLSFIDIVMIRKRSAP